MSIVLYHHPFSRAATVLWMLEEVGVEYELRFVDMMKGAQKQPEFLALNEMGKLPVRSPDGDMVVSEGGCHWSLPRRSLCRRQAGACAR